MHETSSRSSSACINWVANASINNIRQFRWVCEHYHPIRCVNTSNFQSGTFSESFSRDADAEESSSDMNGKIFTTQWETMFQQLKDYKSIHGDTLVPSRYPENPSLGHFVDNNRQAYRMRLEYERSCAEGRRRNPSSNAMKFIMMMTDEKIEGELVTNCQLLY